MKNTSVIRLLQSLTRKELNELRKFAASPFHNNKKNVLRFFDLISKYYPDFDEKEVNSGSLFRLLYPKRKYKPDVIIRLSSRLYILTKEYLVIKKMKEDVGESKLCLLKCLLNRKSDKLFQKELESAKKHFRGEKFDIDYFERRWKLEQIQILYTDEKDFEDIHWHIKRTGDFSVYNFLVKFFLAHHNKRAALTKLAFNSVYENSAFQYFSENFDFENFEGKLNIEENHVNDNLLLHYYNYLLHRYPEKKKYYYSKLKEYSLKDIDKLPEEEIKTRFSNLITYCIRKIREGDQGFRKENFEIYKHFFALVPSEMGVPTSFRNFVTEGLRLGEFDYIKKFISDNGWWLPEFCREDLINFHLSELSFTKKDFSKALNFLKQVKLTYYPLKDYTRQLYSKLYYETSQFDSLFSLIDTDKHYIRNNKNLPSRARRVLFFKYLEKLARIKSGGSTENIEDLLRIMKVEKLAMHPWLMEKAEELKREYAPARKDITLQESFS